MAHILYIPACILIGVFIGHRLGRESARREMEKKKRVEEARKARAE